MDNINKLKEIKESLKESNQDEMLKVFERMKASGGSFEKKLAELWMVADSVNSRKIEETFVDEINKFIK